MRYKCPVCGFADLENPPEDYFICPCCGTEFAYDDVGHTHSELRKMWISAGAHWFAQQSPIVWNPWQQLIDAGYAYDIPYFNTPKFVAREIPASYIFVPTPRAA